MHMTDLIEERKNTPQEERRADLLSNLLEGTENEATGAAETENAFRFGDEELVGRCSLVQKGSTSEH